MTPIITTWVLVLFTYGGRNVTGSAYAPAMSSVPGFSSKFECENGGLLVKGLLDGLATVKYVCIEQHLAPEKTP